MEKKRLVVSYSNLSTELQQALKKKYPYGYADYVMKVNTSNNNYFYAVTLDTDDASYLVKVNVKIDANVDDLEDKDYGNDTDEGDSFGDGEEDFDNFPDIDE